MDLGAMDQAETRSLPSNEASSTVTDEKCKQHSIDAATATDDDNTRTSSSKETQDNIVSWDGPSDPENPKNWTPTRKWLIVTTTCLMTFTVTFSSSVFSAAVATTAEEFHTSSEVMVLGVSLFVLGFAISPIVYGPMSEVYGRTLPLWVGMTAFCIFQIPVAVAQNLETIFICRSLQAIFGAAPIGVLGGLYFDILEPIEIGVALSVFAGVVFASPAAGPIVGSFLTQSKLGWRWTAWITLIVGAIFTIAAWIVTPETFAPVILARKAKRLRYKTKNWALHAESEEQRVDLRALVTKYLTKPIRMLFKEPILAILTVYTTFLYGLLYMTFLAYPVAFQVRRGWNPNIASLPFLANFVGISISSICTGVFSKTWYARRWKATQRLTPEDRLPPMIAGSILLPVGLFWFAWTSDPSIHWAPQVISGAFIGGGIISIFMPAILYIIDVYLSHANSAIAINTCIRTIVGAWFPMFATQMYTSLGVDWATSLLGFISVALMPFPLVFWLYGKKIRSWSKFAFNV